MDEGTAPSATESVESVGPDSATAAPAAVPPLEAGEQVIARRLGARLRTADASGLSADTSDGTLYLTERRLIHAGAVQSIPLSEIAEITLAGDSLLVSLRDGRGFALEVESAEDLRSAIAVQLKQQSQSPSL